MPDINLIVLRLHPIEPVTAADFEANSLEGLTITAYDLSYAHPSPPTQSEKAHHTGNIIGTAQYLPKDPKNTPIVQHAEQVQDPPTIAPGFPFFIPGNTHTVFHSVATAIIQVNEPGLPPKGTPEYQTRDIYLVITRDVTDQNGVITTRRIVDTTIDFNAANAFVPSLPDPKDPANFMKLNTSTYVALPATALHPGDAYLELPTDGSPPNFTDLNEAITTVLAGDPQTIIDPTTKKIDQAKLDDQLVELANNPQKCRHITYEIAWSREFFPLPVPPPDQPLEALYTLVDPKQKQDDKIVQARQKFEGALASYYAKHNAEAEQLAKYVYALAASVACERISQQVTSARFQFPIVTTDTIPTPLKETEVLLTNWISPTMDLTFMVPREYFYALGVGMPPQITPKQQYQIATHLNSPQILDKIQHASDSGVIDLNLPISATQAARQLNALATGGNEDPICIVGNATSPIYTIVKAWLTYTTDDDINHFWIGPPPSAGAVEIYSQGYLELILCAITNGYTYADPKDNTNTTRIPLSKTIETGLPVSTVKDLAKVPEEDLAKVPGKNWQDFFKNNAPNPQDTRLLPTFTLPGTPDERVRAFVRHLRNFFDVSSSVGLFSPPTLDGPPLLPRTLDNDPIQSFVSSYKTPDPAGGPDKSFAFGMEDLDPHAPQFQHALDDALPNDPVAQEWLTQTILTINDLYLLTNKDVLPPPPLPGKLNPPSGKPSLSSFQFSVMEALYARGFTSIQSVQNLTQDELQQALTGTIAYSYAPVIYENAHGAKQSGQTQPGKFSPINPDGCLVNCLPPLHLSPLGPVAYLHEMLHVSASSTCENPLPSDSTPTLGEVIAKRRGPLGTLQVTQANLETPLPRIDLINECLEALAATTSTPASGVVHNTNSDTLGNHALCIDDEESEATRKQSALCHEPTKLFETMPEFSSPAFPITQAAAYDNLRNDFSSPSLPYSQPLDISRSYLRQLETSRYALMRRFRKDITEFVLAPSAQIPEFQSHLWRYPVRFDIAIEYLSITPEEYHHLFEQDITRNALPAYYGFDLSGSVFIDWIVVVLRLPEFLKRTGLIYCEFLELWQAEFVVFRRIGEIGSFPDCEPCCLDEYMIQFVDTEDLNKALRQLIIFIRLWRKLREVHGAQYSFAQLSDICHVLHLFNDDGTINADFMRQLAAFQILRDHLGLRLSDPADQQAHTIDEERTHLLALWIGKSARKWSWAVDQLLDHIQYYAQARHKRGRRAPEFIKLIAANLDPLSHLAGFDPERASDTWFALPTHTLRFAEVLSKIYASDFSVGEILFLFTADAHLDGDDPFPLADENETLDMPFALPDDQDKHSLWALRRKLLSVHIAEEETEEWNWPRIEASLRRDFGLTPTNATDSLLSLAQHFFPHILEHYGSSVDRLKRQYRVKLEKTDALMWNTPDDPFRYDASASQLWVQLPLKDEAVIERLSHIKPLDADEQAAVQDLYFLPRAQLAPFAFIFSNFAEATERLIEEEDEIKRWHYFRREFARCHARCRIIAEHLAQHVTALTDQKCPDSERLAWYLLEHLYADENKNQAGTLWEVDAGTIPPVTWQPQPNGGAFAALLGLAGTGLYGEFTSADGGLPLWHEVRGPINAFGHEENRWNAPIPTILPSMNLNLSAEQQRFMDVRNGFALKDRNDEMLGGAQGFGICWQGTLLIEHDGSYEFFAGAPTPDGHKPNFEAAEHHRWHVVLRRGQKTWVVLSHHWLPEQAPAAGPASLLLRQGAYQLTVEFAQSPPVFEQEDAVCPQHTGFQLKYAGPDSEHQIVAIPFDRLYRDVKDEKLGKGIDFGQRSDSVAREFLDLYYTSSLRDMRRTYQRAFKALLFALRFALSAQPLKKYGQSEIGYMLAHPDRFEGTSYYRQDANFQTHHVSFDFNFLPLLDPYHAPSFDQDQRVQPSTKRQQALFDWWERVFDYVQIRRQTSHTHEHPLWLLFDEAAEKQPDNPAHLLRHMGVDLRHTNLVAIYYSIDPSSTTQFYTVSSDDIEDERWAIRIWRAEQWLRALETHFAAKDIRTARPDLWAADDPNLPSTESGNQNLTQFVSDGCFENGAPRRYKDVKRLNDSLRERARKALIASLCSMHRILLPWGGFAQEPEDLSALLLLDVEAGICERVSRIEEAISAIQIFVQRCRLGLEPNFNVSPEFVLCWERRFATFRLWEACKRRELYRENWIDWDEMQKARRTEGFRFLESRLQQTTLTIPNSGGLEYWPHQQVPTHSGLALLQVHDLSHMRQFTQTPQLEGFDLLGTPERQARLSWLAALHQEVSSQGTPPPEAATPTVLSGKDAFIRDSSPAEQTTADTVLSDTNYKLPLWIQSAIRLGTRFLRVTAAGEPPASTAFRPQHGEQDAGCCRVCGKCHQAITDEYYFWLLDTRYYVEPIPAQPPLPGQLLQDASLDWHNPEALPGLLHWDVNPMVHLLWCRVHNGEFQQPRRSDEGVRVDNAATAQLVLLGRADDSLTFRVDRGEAPAGIPIPPQPPQPPSTQLPGFRYDLATDTAVVLPLPVDPPVPNGFHNLLGYPYFAYFAPGARLVPSSLFSPALSVAAALRTHCHFEAALKWYELAFNPLQNDCSWCVQEQQVDLNTIASSGQPGEVIVNPSVEVPEVSSVEIASNPQVKDSLIRQPEAVSGQERLDTTCCQSITTSDEVAEDRSITLHYLETLIEWGKSVMHRNSPEAYQQAQLIFDTAERILGMHPRSVTNVDRTKGLYTVDNFNPYCAPLNPRLLALYDLVDDRLMLIHTCLSAFRLSKGRSDGSLSWGGKSSQRQNWQTTDMCTEDEERCCPHSPYRFLFLVQKAQEISGAVRELGAALLAAFEKGDAEYLASLRATHERQLLDLALSLKQNQWREADWQVQSLQKTKEGAQARLQYYTTQINNALISGEEQYSTLVDVTLGAQGASIVSEVIAMIMRFIPDLFAGEIEDTQVPLGTKLGETFSSASHIASVGGEMASTTGSFNLNQAGWDRREIDWRQQVTVITIELEQIERQLLASERRRDIALRELNNHQRQMEQSAEVLDFLRDKFTNHALYLFLQQETAALHTRMYELALCTARQAQKAFNYERGHTTRRFLPVESWDNLHESLLAGERLQLALRQMEKAYLDENVREYELMKHFSLRLHFPREFLHLKATGRCEITIPEWMFDLDYPGHYMRRIKNVTLTIPCVVGPYTGIHCRLTLLGSATRIDSCLIDPPTSCCDDDDLENGYQLVPNDSRVVIQYAAREAIATSSGQNDAGLFELNFRDERYLPFEFEGAVSRWRIELPQENNQFDVDTLTDVVLHLNYTAREGGDRLSQVANAIAQRYLPGSGLRFFDVKHEFPDTWHRFQDISRDERSARHLSLRLGRDMFPFIPGHCELYINRLEILFQAPEAEPSTHHMVRFQSGRKSERMSDDQDERRVHDIPCIASAEWPSLYHGVLDLHLGLRDQRGHHDLGTFAFPHDTGIVSRIFLFCRYEVMRKRSDERFPEYE